MMIRRNTCFGKAKTAVKIINAELPAVTTFKYFVLFFASGADINSWVIVGWMKCVIGGIERQNARNNNQTSNNVRL